jgi:ribonuclease HI
MKSSDGRSGFLPFEEEDIFQGIRTEKSQYVEGMIYCDGASSGNPGHAGIGVVIKILKNQKKDYKIAQYIGETTNNVAEYSALIRGLEEAHSLGLKRVAIFLDSELLVKQLSGFYRIKSKNLKPLWDKAQKILRKFDSATIKHIRRDLNKEADALAKKSIKEAVRV